MTDKQTKEQSLRERAKSQENQHPLTEKLAAQKEAKPVANQYDPAREIEMKSALKETGFSQPDETELKKRLNENRSSSYTPES